MTPRRAALSIVVVVLAACSSDGSGSTTTSLGVTTIPAAETTTAGAVTTTTATAGTAVALRGDGVGVAALGADPADAISAVTAELGDPTTDTGWDPSSSHYGTCPGAHIRGVEWGGLVLLFTDGDTSYGSGAHLFSWRITGAPPALSTATGLGWGATKADAEDLYPGAVDEVPPEDPFPGYLTIHAEGGDISAFLDGDDIITNLEAGTPCGE